jgi:hypothetical protein
MVSVDTWSTYRSGASKQEVSGSTEVIRGRGADCAMLVEQFTGVCACIGCAIARCSGGLATSGAEKGERRGPGGRPTDHRALSEP